MKKLLLLSVVALGGLCASAQSFSDYYEVTFEGKKIASGSTIVSETIMAESWYQCDVIVTNIYEQPINSASLKIVGELTGTPTVEQLQSDPITWGLPTICYQIIGGMGNCIPHPLEQVFSDFTLDTTAPVEIQLEVQATPEGKDMVLPSRAGFYKIEVSATIDGKALSDSFVYYVAIGPNATGVDSVAADDAEAVYYDMTGRRVLNPAKGQLVIERKGAKAVKKVL